MAPLFLMDRTLSNPISGPGLTAMLPPSNNSKNRPLTYQCYYVTFAGSLKLIGCVSIGAVATSQFYFLQNILYLAYY